jgi:hypothetical protein
VLSDKQIKQFQILYRRHFNEDITKDEALKKGISLINLLRIICRPTSDIENKNYDDYNKLQKNYKQL